jgi:ligand-binding SRPBCC domain-containing protein
MRFRILTISLPRRIYEGQMIHYRIQLLPFIWVNWLTEITKVKEKEYFIDDQRIGPYKIWHHQHHFAEVDGGVEMRDAITYAIPFGWIGRIANWLFVSNQLTTIFKYRRSVLEEKFGKDLRKTIAV